MSIIIGGNSGGAGRLDPNDNLPEQITFIKYEHTSTTITLYWNNPTEYFDGVLIVRNTHTPENIKDGVEVYRGGGTQCKDTGLTDNTFYVYRAFPYNDKGQYQTQVNTFICQTYDGKILTIGRHIGDSNPANMWYADDAITMSPSLGNNGNFIDNGWSDVWPFNEIKPCLLKDGFVVGYLNPNDFTKFEDGTAADITSGNSGDVMIEFPKMGMRILRDSINEFYQITNVESLMNGEFKPYAFTRNTIGDCDKLYVGVCNGYVANGKLRSLAGKTPSGKVTMSQFRSYAKANGDYYDIVSFYPWTLLQMLYLIRYRNLNSQQALGNGNSNNSNVLSTGNSLSMKMNYGMNTSTNQPVTCNGIENMWSNVFQFIDGVKVDANYNILTSYTNFTDDSSYVNVGKTSLINRTYISNIFDSNDNITLKGFFPTEANGTETTFYCDDAKIDSSKDCIRAGGQHITGSTDGAGTRNGVFRMITDNVSSNGNDMNARLMYLAPSDHTNRVAQVTNFAVVPDINKNIITWKNPEQSLTRNFSNFAGVKIVRSETGIPTTHDATGSGEVLIYDGNGEKFVDENLSYKTYYYRIFSYNSAGEHHYNRDKKCWARLCTIRQPFTIDVDLIDTNPFNIVSYSGVLENLCPQKVMKDEIGMHISGPDWGDFEIFNSIKPCLLKNGKVVGYLDKNDYSKFEDGTEADITSGDSGDVMIEFLGISIKMEEKDNKLSFSIVRNNPPSNANWYSQTAQRRYEHDCYNIYIGAYPGVIKDNKLRSLAGVDFTNGSQSAVKLKDLNELAYNVADDDWVRAGYSNIDYCRLVMLQLLYLMRFKNFNVREALELSDYNKKGTYVTGDMNKDGMNSIRESVNINDIPITKINGIEHMTGPLKEAIVGIWTDSDSSVWWQSGMYDDGIDNHKTKIRSYDKYPGVKCIPTEFLNPQTGFYPKRGWKDCEAHINDNTCSIYETKPNSYCYFGDDDRRKTGMFSVQVKYSNNIAYENTYGRLMYMAPNVTSFSDVTPIFSENKMTVKAFKNSLGNAEKIILVRNTQHYPQAKFDGDIVSELAVTPKDGYTITLEDNTIKPGIEYFYRLFSLNDAGNYGMSVQFSGSASSPLGGVDITRDDSTFKLNINPTGIYTPTAASYGNILTTSNLFPYNKIKMCCINNGEIRYKYDDGFTNTSATWSDGTAVGVNEYNTSGNWMVEIPIFGYRIKKNGGTISVEITEDQNANEADGWSYDAFRTEPNGPKKKLYVGEFLSTNVGGVLKSYPNSVPFQGDSANLETCYNMAVANGSGWSLINYHTITIFQILYLLAYRMGDCQNRFANGIVDSNTFSNTGLPNKLMYADINPGNNQRVKFLGLEDCWGNLEQWVLGAYVKSDGLYTGFNFSKTGEGYTKQVSFTPDRDGTAKDIVGTTSAGFYPSEIIQFNENRYYCDRIFDYNNCGMTWGGPYNCLKEAGVFYMRADQDVNYGAKTFGARLIYHAP